MHRLKGTKMTKRRRAAALLLLAVAAVMAFPTAALANIGISGNLSVSSNNVTVDAPGHQATVTVTNTNTPPQNNDSNTLTELSVALSCGVTGTSANVCASPDIGAIQTATTATGDAGTACAGRTFNISGPDGSGVYSFTVVGSPVVLAPPGGANSCAVTFPLYFRRVPVVDSSAAAGVQTQLNTRARLTHNLSPTVVTSNLSVQITVVAPVGGNGVADFNGDGLTDRSVYRGGAWFVQNQTVVYHGLPGDIPVPADYDGNGTTDRVVYRDGAWFNHTKETVYYGLAGDIPVPADYTDDGKVDRAVYRGGAWFVEGQPTVYFGLPGDIPVPADYNGDGDAERAVYRDGAWFVEGMETVYFGLPGDIPVPADYNGDGDFERAVYRGGTWFREGLSTVSWGLPDDIPAPGDYNNDDLADMGVYRDGTWFVAGFTTSSYGLPGDIPLPLPQAIYRKFF
jgi:hypothetical protein